MITCQRCGKRSNMGVSCPWCGVYFWDTYLGYCPKNGQLKPGDCEDTEP